MKKGNLCWSEIFSDAWFIQILFLIFCIVFFFPIFTTEYYPRLSDSFGYFYDATFFIEKMKLESVLFYQSFESRWGLFSHKGGSYGAFYGAFLTPFGSSNFMHIVNLFLAMASFSLVLHMLKSGVCRIQWLLLFATSPMFVFHSQNFMVESANIFMAVLSFVFLQNSSDNKYKNLYLGMFISVVFIGSFLRITHLLHLLLLPISKSFSDGNWRKKTIILVGSIVLVFLSLLHKKMFYAPYPGSVLLYFMEHFPSPEAWYRIGELFYKNFKDLISFRDANYYLGYKFSIFFLIILSNVALFKNRDRKFIPVVLCSLAYLSSLFFFYKVGEPRALTSFVFLLIPLLLYSPVLIKLVWIPVFFQVLSYPSILVKAKEIQNEHLAFAREVKLKLTPVHDLIEHNAKLLGGERVWIVLDRVIQLNANIDSNYEKYNLPISTLDSRDIKYRIYYRKPDLDKLNTILAEYVLISRDEFPSLEEVDSRLGYYVYIKPR